MAIELNTTPYYDDFDAGDSFLKILFNPGRAVQARELTQIQSILQNQLSASADHLWKDGTAVLGGQVGVNKINYIKLATADNAWLGRVVRGATSNAIGIITKLHDDEAEPYYYIKPVSGYFRLGSEDLESYDDVCIGGVDPVTGQCPTNTYFNYALSGTPMTGTIVAVGQGLEATITNGIFYTNGAFTPVEEQTIFIDYYGTTPSEMVGIQSVESIKTATDNAKLLDPASGFYNQNAPGADRLHMQLKLVLKSDITASGDIDAVFIPLCRVVDGLVQTINAEVTTYAKIADELAKRTYDESGDYVVDKFNIEIDEDYAGDPEKFSVKIFPGKAYIKGYEATLDNPIVLTGNKGRETYTINNDRARVDFGPYFEVQTLADMHGIFDILHKEKVVLFSMEGTSIVEYDGTNYGDGPNNSGASYALQYGEEKRITHVTSYAGGFRIYINTPDGLDDIKGATYIRSSLDEMVWAKLHRPLGYAEYKGTFVPWTVEFAPFMSSIVSGQTNYSTQKIFDVEMTGSIMSIPASYPTMHWERVLYVWNTTTNALVPQFGTETTGTGWFADYTGNETLVLTMLNQDDGEATNALSTDNLRIMSDMYISNATYRSVNESTYTNQESTIVQDVASGWWVLEGKPGMTEVTSVIGPDGVDYWDSSEDGSLSDNWVGESFMLEYAEMDTQFEDGIVYWVGPSDPPPGVYTMSFKTRDYGNTNTSNFLCVNSYTDTGIDYGNIHVWQGRHHPYPEYRLSDTLDFRVTELDYNIGNYLPLPETYITTSYTYFLPHSDRLTLNTHGKFQIREGFSSIDALLPSEGRDEMTLYQIAVPQYTYNVKNINTVAIDHKQYQMDDIRDIEERLSDLEYYSALNLLEVSSSALNIKDSDGLERYKNGIFVDAFADHGFGDIANPEYWVRMQSQGGGGEGATSPWNEEHIEFELNTSDPENMLEQSGKMITLPWTLDENCVQSIFASRSINLNPYAKISFMGFVTITPSTDSWFEQTYAPEIVVQDANNAAMIAQAAGSGSTAPTSSSAGRWTGISRNSGNATTMSSLSTEQVFDARRIGTRGGPAGTGRWNGAGNGTIGANTIVTIQGASTGLTAPQIIAQGWARGPGTIAMGTTGVPQTRRPTRAWLVRQQAVATTRSVTTQARQTATSVTRSSTRTWQETVTRREEIADRLIDVSALPFMRPKTITINADCLRPDTTHLVIFGNKDVSSVSHPAGGSNGTPIVSDGRGQIVNATFNLPCDGGTRNIAAGNGLRFTTGIQEFGLVDTTVTEEVSSFATATYTARGTLNTRQKTILSIEEIIQRSSTRTWTETVWVAVPPVVTRATTRNTTLVGVNRIREYYDPVAESFMLPSETGGFVKSIDLFFRTRDETPTQTPVVLEIRPMENGYPTPFMIPGARVVKYPDEIFTSDNGTSNTRFEFDTLIPLMGGEEYCMVVISDSLDYNIWISELGGRDRATNEYIGAQPYLGSMFTSQNNRTWTAEQTRDIKFNINCAKFMTSENGPIRGRFDSKEFIGEKKMIGFQQNFRATGSGGSTVNYTSKINSGLDALVPDHPTNDSSPWIFGAETIINGAHTLASGYQFTPISVELDITNPDPHTSPMWNAEFISAITIDAIEMPQEPTATKIEAGVVVSDYDIEKRGRYISRTVTFKDPADDLIMYISLQEIPETSFKVYYDTGKVIPKWLEVEMNANGTSFGDYTINDYEEDYAVVYQDNPYTGITGGSTIQANWNGTIGQFDSSVYIDGDDNTSNDTKGFLTDISSQVNITHGAYLCKYDLEGTQKDNGVFASYAVDDIWFGTAGDDQDKRFWRKVLRTDGTLDAVEVPVLKIISIVATDHVDFHGGGINASAVIVDPAITWRKMKDLGQSSESQFTARENDFIEHTFIPLKKITKEFTTFRIKIEMFTTDPCFLPSMKELRVLAVT
jgi:hypothetical protein